MIGLFKPPIRIPESRTFEGAVFEDIIDRNSGRTIADLTLRRCQFIDCVLSITRDPSRRSTVRNVQLVQCEQAGCDLNGVIVENVLVDGLKTRTLLQSWGAVFKHVTFRGKIGRIMLSNVQDLSDLDSKRQRAFDAANAAFYATVDWALDITEAEFAVCDVRGVPGRLVKRDPETQALVTRERAEGDDRWRTIVPDPAPWRVAIEFMLRDPRLNDVVLVAGKRSRNFKVELEGIRRLRDAGIAEPD